jgi:hypothetical protein
MPYLRSLRLGKGLNFLPLVLTPRSRLLERRPRSQERDRERMERGGGVIERCLIRLLASSFSCEQHINDIYIIIGCNKTQLHL